jgi:hypothetical protein
MDQSRDHGSFQMGHIKKVQRLCMQPFSTKFAITYFY